MPLTPSITPSPSLQQAQTANMEAQKANLTNGNTQISGGIPVGSTGTYNPGQVQTNQVPTIAPPAQVQTSGAVSATPKLPTQEATPTPVLPNTQSTTTSQPTTSATQDQNWIGNVKPATLPTTKPATPSNPVTPAPTVSQTAMPDLYTKATADDKSKADSLISAIDPVGVMDPTTQAMIKNAYLSGDQSKMKAILDANNIDFTQQQNAMNALRTTRDASLSENRMTSQASLANDRAVQEYDTAIAQQQAKVKATANNMAVMQDTAGRLQSQNMADAIVGEMQMQQRILQNLQNSKSWALGEIASNAKYQHDVLANNYNDAMSQYDYQLQDQIKNLSDTGLAGTAKGLSMLQSNIEKTGLAKLALSQQYAKSLQSATDIMKMQVDKKTLNIDATNQINDGYLHNAQGEVVVGPSGKPLVSNPQKKLSTTTTDSNGNLIALYADGTHSVITEGQPVSIQEIHNYAKAAQAGGLDVLKTLPINVQNQIKAYMGQSGMVGLDVQMKQQQLAQAGWEKGENGTMVNPVTREVWNPATTIDRQTAMSKYGSTPAVRNFNPGNIMDTGFGGQKVEGERFTRFNTPQEGFNALVSKIQNIQAGNSKVYSPDMTLVQYISKYAPSSDNNNPQAYAQGIANNLGISVDTQIKDIDPTKLALEHARHEDGNSYRMLQDLGVTGKSLQSSPEREFSQDQKNLMDIVGNNPTKEDLAQMQKAGLSYTDLANYVRSNKGANAPQSLYDVVLNPKATEGQRASYKYALRMTDSEKPIQDMENKYKDSWAITEMLAPSGVAPEFMKTTDRQKYEQAQRDWVNANLRKESGAVISDSEFTNAAKQYFPQSGDSNEVIDQKRKDRYNATYGMLKEVGRDENGNEIAQIYAQKNQGTPQQPTAPSQDRVNNIKNLLMKK